VIIFVFFVSLIRDTHPAQLILRDLIVLVILNH
jgi:hypothetical protein